MPSRPPARARTHITFCTYARHDHRALFMHIFTFHHRRWLSVAHSLCLSLSVYLSLLAWLPSEPSRSVLAGLSLSLQRTPRFKKPWLRCIPLTSSFFLPRRKPRT